MDTEFKDTEFKGTFFLGKSTNGFLISDQGILQRQKMQNPKKDYFPWQRKQTNPF